MSDFKLQMQHPVLVIDDEADLRALLQMSLSKMGLQVETAAGVVEGKKKLSEKTYDLVLTDMKMPDGNGLEVVEFVAKNSDTPIAVMRRESLGALRSGVYATFSTKTPRRVLTVIARAMATTGGRAKLAIA